MKLSSRRYRVFSTTPISCRERGKECIAFCWNSFWRKKTPFVHQFWFFFSQYFRCVVERCQTAQKKLFKLFGDRRIKISTYLCCYRCILPIFAYYVHFNRNSSLKITRLFFFFFCTPNCETMKRWGRIAISEKAIKCRISMEVTATHRAD